MLRFLRAALAGEMVDGDVRHVRGQAVPAGAAAGAAPELLLAALRPKMLRLAAAEADGVILNWLSVEDVPRARSWPRRRGGSRWRPASSSARPRTPSIARETARRLIAAYLTVPAYAAFHRWLGRGEVLEPMWDAWAAGDRKAALAAIPDEVVDALIVHGRPEGCREQVQRYVDAGVTTPVMALLPTPELTAAARPRGPAATRCGQLGAR